jgi:hypothetical protein
MMLSTKRNPSHALYLIGAKGGKFGLELLDLNLRTPVLSTNTGHPKHKPPSCLRSPAEVRPDEHGACSALTRIMPWQVIPKQLAYIAAEIVKLVGSLQK